jgi:hypothetical protein
MMTEMLHVLLAVGSLPAGGVVQAVSYMYRAAAASLVLAGDAAAASCLDHDYAALIKQLQSTRLGRASENV